AVPIAGLQVELSSSVEISILSASGADATWENGVLTFENEIGSNETVLFQVELSADCVAAIPVFVNCLISHSTSIEASEFNVNFNTLAPSLNIVEFSDPSVVVAPGQEFTRSLVVRNAGNQSLDSFTVSISGSEAVELQSSSIGTIVNGELVLDGNDFSDTTFDPEEDIEITLTETLLSCGSHELNYAVWWSCNGQDACQTSIANSTVSHQPGEPNILLEAISAADPAYCEEPGWSSFQLSNLGIETEPGAASANDLKMSFGVGWPGAGDIGNSKYSGEYFIVSSVEVNGELFPLDSAIIDPTISNSRKLYQLVLDEVNVGEDLDVVVNWFFRWPNNNNPDCEDLEDVVYHGSMNMQADFINACGVEKPSVFSAGAGSLFQYRELTEEWLSPTDADDGESFVLGIKKEMRIEGPVCANPKYVLLMYPPNGINLVPNSAFGFRESLARDVTATELPNHVYRIAMDLPANNSIAPYGEMELGAEFQLVCSELDGSGIPYEVFLECSDCDNAEFTSKLSCGTSYKLNAQCGTCDGLQLPSNPTLERISFGHADTEQLIPFTAEDAVLDGTINKCLTHDQFSIHAPSVLSGISNVEEVFLELSHSKFNENDGELLNFTSGSVSFYDDSSDSYYTSELDQPSLDIGASITYQFDLRAFYGEQGAPPLGFILNEQDSIIVDLVFQVTEEALANERTEWTEVEDFRIQYRADDLLCNSRGLELFVAHPTFQWVGNNNISPVSDCETYKVGWSFRNNGQTNDQLYPNEYRPMVTPNSVSFWIPDGWSYSPNSLKLDHLPINECLVAQQNSFTSFDDPISSEEDDGVRLTWFNQGNWPLPDDGCIYLSLQYNFELELIPDCTAEDAADRFILSEFNYSNNAYTSNALSEAISLEYNLFKPEDQWTAVPFSILSVQGSDITSTGEAQWVVRVLNESGSHSLNGVWLAVESDGDSGATVNSVYDDNENPIDLIEVNGFMVFSSLEVPPGQFIDYTINGSIQSCDIGEIQIKAGKACVLDLIDIDPTDSDCVQSESNLTFSSEETELQVNFIPPPVNATWCESQVYEVVLNNALLGYVG
ncbi:MAG: hypothetical protein ACPGED_03945, partial [Flavobacteriales bacterium]